MLISAFGIHTGGGANLLDELVEAIDDEPVSLVLDSRYRHPVRVGRASYVPAKLWARLATLIRLGSYAEGHDVLLCLNGLPPLFRSPAYTICYFHAPYLARTPEHVVYRWQTRVRFALERLLLRLGRHNLDEIWVQTPATARDAETIAKGTPVTIAPFVPASLAAELRNPQIPEERGDFFYYPADNLQHKNHARLLKAWKMLAEVDITPPLVLTVTPAQLTEIARGAAVDLTQLTHVTAQRTSYATVQHNFLTCRALIFPSLAETYGLPQLEAVAVGAPVIASERDFVRDVCSPVESFDPESVTSIARAVRRFLGREDPPTLPADGKSFLAALREVGRRKGGTRFADTSVHPPMPRKV